MKKSKSSSGINAKQLKQSNIPKSIGVIIDGNRRWAKERKLSTHEGHIAGYQKLKQFVSWANRAGVKNIIVYTFSTENWKRAKNEVKDILNILRFALSAQSEKQKIKEEQAKVKIIGQVKRFSKDIQKLISDIEKETAHFKGPNLVFALSYGGRAEIIESIKKIIESKVNPKAISEKFVSDMLWTKGIADPDLIIRTGGDLRLSNFLPWQSVYSELFFVKTYWPSFSRKQFDKILKEFSERERRRGK